MQGCTGVQDEEKGLKMFILWDNTAFPTRVNCEWRKHKQMSVLPSVTLAGPPWILLCLASLGGSWTSHTSLKLIMWKHDGLPDHMPSVILLPYWHQTSVTFFWLQKHFIFLNPANWPFNPQTSLNCNHWSRDWSRGSLVWKDFQSRYWIKTNFEIPFLSLPD